MDFVLNHLELLVLIVVGIFIAFNPSTFVRRFDKKALQTEKWVRWIGILMAGIFIGILVFNILKNRI